MGKGERACDFHIFRRDLCSAHKGRIGAGCAQGKKRCAHAVDAKFMGDAGQLFDQICRNNDAAWVYRGRGRCFCDVLQCAIRKIDAKGQAFSQFGVQAFVGFGAFIKGNQGVVGSTGPKPRPAVLPDPVVARSAMASTKVPGVSNSPFSRIICPLAKVADRSSPPKSASSEIAGCRRRASEVIIVVRRARTGPDRARMHIPPSAGSSPSNCNARVAWCQTSLAKDFFHDAGDAGAAACLVQRITAQTVAQGHGGHGA